MRRRKIVAACLAALALAILLLVSAVRPPRLAQRMDASNLAVLDVQNAMQEALPPADLISPSLSTAPGSTDNGAPIPVSLPRIAYIYRLGFRLPEADVSSVQEAHLALCRRLGAARCQLLSLSRSSADDAAATGALTLRVASALAADFSKMLHRSVEKVGGRANDMAIQAEDVSKDMVDTEARIHQREILVSRLTEMLKDRSGKVSELVEAERSIAGAQEELDKARTWLGELRGRVAMSTFDIRYQAAAAAPVPVETGFGGELRHSIAGSLNAVVAVFRRLLVIGIFLLPWLVLLVPLLWWARRRILARRSIDDVGDDGLAPATA